MDRYLSRQQICHNLQISKQSLWRWCKTGMFPKPVKLGPRSIAWRESDVTAWEASRERVSYAAADTDLRQV